MREQELTRDNHYVPIWYQKGFLAKGQKKLNYLDLTPSEIRLPNGQTKLHKELFESYPTQCFYQTDLYSTFFGTRVIDEVEKKLFGNIDARGKPAIQAFTGDDVTAWHKSFQDLFLFLDAQKFRTPKGLDWIRARYPRLDQNTLMMEMQGVRTTNCTLWSEGVREIVSARDAAVKFIITDHPVTIYNSACQPGHTLCLYPNDPAITLKGSQTLFPLDQDHCLILTHLEHAQDPTTTDPLEKRTFSRPVRESIVRTDKFIKKRQLGDAEVIAINYVLKSRARRFIAAGAKDWLWPEREFQGNWGEMTSLLLPPEDELWHFGGEIFMRHEGGDVHYQDAYGRTRPASDALSKDVKEADLRPNDPCGCGSGRKYKVCCRDKPAKARTSWKSLSIRERNLGFFRGVNAILGTDSGKDWDDVRRELDEEKVKRIHELVGFIWPIDTDLFELLPKPDGRTRAVYSGMLDPRTTPFAVANACLYFGDVLVQNPFMNPNQVNKEFSPVEKPHGYLLSTLRNLMLFFQLAPLIESGRVNLFPDPASVDPFLQRYAMNLAEQRSGRVKPNERDEAIFRRLWKDDHERMLCMLPESAVERLLRQADPAITTNQIKHLLDHLQEVRESDPLVLLRDGVYGGGDEGGQLTPVQLAPNFELLLLIAQATGAVVVTDSHHRWDEIRAASHLESGRVVPRIPEAVEGIAATVLPVCESEREATKMLDEGRLEAHRTWFHGLLGQLRDPDAQIADHQLQISFEKASAAARKEFKGHAAGGISVRLRYAAPVGGIYHNHVQRLMVRCGIDDRPDRVTLGVLLDFQEGTYVP